LSTGIARRFVANRPPFIPGLKSGVFPAVSYNLRPPVNAGEWIREILKVIE
jgi:hypothetical protein